MNEALGDDAWTKLHGPNEIPKSYVPPFLRESEVNKKQADDFKQREQERMDNLYSIEIEAGLNRGANKQ